MSVNKSKGANYRSAVNGRFITKDAAEKAPRESVREARPAPTTQPKKGRK